jgi:RNA polymerase sigma-70 factor (ECF subfamily)
MRFNEKRDAARPAAGKKEPERAGGLAGLTDEALMEQFQKGSSDSFATLLERHRRGIYNFVLRHVGDQGTAEDLLQDTFLRVVQGADSYKLESKFTTWLYTIARNLCVDHARKMRFRRHKSLDQPTCEAEAEGPTLMDRVAGPGAPPDRSAIGTELQVRLSLAIATLNDEQREVFLMREYSNLPFKEIAEVVGVPENTVKSRMRYALEHLRKQLSEYQDYAKALS